MCEPPTSTNPDPGSSSGGTAEGIGTDRWTVDAIYSVYKHTYAPIGVYLGTEALRAAVLPDRPCPPTREVAGEVQTHSLLWEAVLAFKRSSLARNRCELRW
jgi:hypothetical protein